MATELRKSGISVLGNMPWGTHFCCFYETKQDLLDILVPYFKAGLENNEFGLWVISNSELLTLQEAISALRKAVPDLDRHLAERSIEVVGHDAWFLEAGVFDFHRVVNRFKEKLDEAVARGYVGMRMNGSPAWLQNKQELREFEQEFDRLFLNERMVASCTYPLAESGAAELLDAARTHQFAIARRQGNWEIVETPELKQAKQEIQRLNGELEQRVIERTSELRATNEALRREIVQRQQAEDRLRLVIDTIPAMVFTALPDGFVDFVNQRWLQYMGLSLEDVLGWNWDAPIHPEDRASSIDHWRSTMAAGQSAENELRVRRADGIYRWILGRFVPLRDELGKIVKWYGASTDIDDRKRAEDELREQKEILQKIFDHIPVMIAFVGKDGRVELVNRAWERSLGWTLHELEEQHLDIYTLAYPDPQYRQQVLDFVAAATGEWTDLKVRVRDGRVIDMTVAIVHLTDGTSLVIAQDIIERKRAEAERAHLYEQVQASHEQLQILSHQLLQAQEAERRAIARELHDEIGQRLTALGLTLTTSRQLPPDQAQARLAEAQSLVRDLIEQVRNLALDLRPAMLDDLGLLPTLVWLFERYTTQMNLSVRFEHRGLEEQRFGPEVETTAYRIVQEALTNVVRHAGAPDVIVRIWADADTLSVVIQDQGRGFDPQAIRTRASIGLAGMQERAALLGGELTIESARGAGTRVTVVLPLNGGEPHGREHGP
ncbi:MAG: MEDS domain-containing protein [Roseiflexaceae bacterium]